MAIVNVKLNDDWKQLDGTFDLWCEDANCPCAALTGAELYNRFEVEPGNDLWRCCDDGMGDELIKDADDAANTVSVFEDDWFYTAAREINGN